MSEKHPSIHSVSAFWDTPYSEEIWKRLEAVKSDSVAIDDSSKALATLALAVGLPDATEPRVARAIVHRHLDDEEESERIHWTLAISQAPSSEPPSDILAEGERVGGRVGLANLVAGCILEDVPPVGAFIIRLRIKQTQYKCKVLPAAPQRGDPSVGLGRPTIQEQIGYRFENGVSGLEELSIVYVHLDDLFSVTIRARGLLNLKAATWLPYANDVAELVCGTFFTAGDKVG